jgi:two-component system, NarL family, nitrate/nitrite response regulator NarL
MTTLVRQARLLDEGAPEHKRQVDQSTGSVGILIADDHLLFREGLRKLLESELGFKVVGSAADGDEALRLMRQLEPDILLLDLAMPRCSGLEVLRELAGSPSPVRTIILTGSIEKAQIAEAIQLGARGVVLKDEASQSLFESIRQVMAGQYWMGRESVSDLVQVIRDHCLCAQARTGRDPFHLTRRELEIIETTVAGYTNQDMAEKFSISEQTVKHHLTHIFDKLAVSNRLELVLFAVYHQLI